MQGKKVTIMGLGIVEGGEGIVKFLNENKAKVLITDLKSKKELKESLKKIENLPIKLVLGKHRKKDFINTDLIIKNPGVPNNSYYLKIARQNSIPIETDIGIFFELCNADIIGITGTKGKSSTATLLSHLLKTKYPTILAGNIGISPLKNLKNITKKTKVVLELSSFQLEGLKEHKKSPKIALITNIYPDHLNRYKNLKDYIEAKKVIFRFQKPNDILVLNYDNLYLKKLAQYAKSKVYYFSQMNIQNKYLSRKCKKACFLNQNKIFFGNEKSPICDLNDISLSGTHNISNILAATSIAKLYKIPSRNIKKVLKNFKELSGRQEFIKEINKIKYFNDTCATIPEAVIEAIKSLKKRFKGANINLIAGGEDKNLTYKKLAKIIIKEINYLFLLPGSASDKIKSELKKIKPNFPIYLCSSMKDAVKKASKTAKIGDIVLFSPGSASFNLFKNEFDRGRQFNQAINNL